MEALLQNLTLISKRNQSVKETMKNFVRGNGTSFWLSPSTWERYRFAAVAIYLGTVPVFGCRHLCGNGTDLRLSPSMWERYRFAAVAFCVGTVPVCGYHTLCCCMGLHRFGGPEQVERISDSMSNIFLGLCSLLIVSSELPVGRTVKFYFHWPRCVLHRKLMGPNLPPPPKSPQEILLVLISVT
jgi:hypothetical protein